MLRKAGQKGLVNQIQKDLRFQLKDLCHRTRLEGKYKISSTPYLDSHTIAMAGIRTLRKYLQHHFPKLPPPQKWITRIS